METNTVHGHLDQAIELASTQAIAWAKSVNWYKVGFHIYSVMSIIHLAHDHWHWF